jgi:hypothetical protein
MRAVSGIAQRKAVTDAATPGLLVDRSASGRPPSARTVISPGSKPTTTVPSRSVRITRAPAAESLSSVALAG